MCYFVCLEGITFWNIIVGGLGWLDMEGPHVEMSPY
jgi:hypothetical protein